jgi:hypothetical protein
VVDRPRKSPCSAADFGSLIHTFCGHVSCFCGVATNPSSGPGRPDLVSAGEQILSLDQFVSSGERPLGRVPSGMHAPARAALGYLEKSA